MMASIRALSLAVFMIAVVLSGCGQTGPLYLPDKKGKDTEQTLDVQDQEQIDEESEETP